MHLQSLQYFKMFLNFLLIIVQLLGEASINQFYIMSDVEKTKGKLF